VSDFLAIQTQTGWGRVLGEFATWCLAQAGWTVLDVGCGPGLLPALFQRQGCRAFGIDLDLSMLDSNRLHPDLAQADASFAPFPSGTLHLVTASNLLFLLPDPLPALKEISRILRVDGQVCLLNPSENLSVATATNLVEQRGLDGLASESLINWAQRAEKNHRWTASELARLYSSAGLMLTETALRVGPGLTRFGRGVKNNL